MLYDNQILTFNIPQNSHFLIEKYTNGTEWYNIYSDGWCEQGGYVTSSEGTINFKKQFSNTNYYACIIQISNSSGGTYAFSNRIKSKSTTSMNYYVNDSNGNWFTCGYISTTKGKTIIKY